MQQDSVASAEYCWARVKESERMAEEVRDPRNKAIFRELAKRWRRLAEESNGVGFKPLGDNRPRATQV